MSHLLGLLWSWAFLLGLVVGLAGYHCLVLGRCVWRNKHQPLPNGERHRPGYSRMVLGGLVAALVAAYVLNQAQQTHNETVALAESTAACQREFSAAVIDRARISEENDRLSRKHRALLTQHNDKTVDWINKLVYPPPEIAMLPPTDPRREQRNVELTRNYFEQIQKLVAGMRAVEEEQDRIETYRRDHPLAELTCGQTS